MAAWENQDPGLFNKMPANAGSINDIYFPAVGLLCRPGHTDTIFRYQSFFRNTLPEFIGIGDADIDHQVFGKGFIAIPLQDEPAVVSFKTYIVTGIPPDVETQVLEEPGSSFKIIP